MADLAKELADIERELLALTGNQPPNPSQMQIYTVTSSTVSNPQTIKIVFDDGIIRLTNAYAITPGGLLNISFNLGNLELYIGGTAPISFVVVSLGSFHLV